MKLEEWTATIIAELKADGITAETWKGFPLVPSAELKLNFVRIVKWTSPTYAANRNIYAEGCLFTPAGVTP